MEFKITRDGDVLRLRKVLVELYVDGVLLDRRRMFSFPLMTFAKRLARKQKRMTKCARIMMNGMKK